ncbi:MAG: restriction endonuclease subunit S [Candidatus Gracilibacteria bacterium]|nr:restriction endonuclease subunit S [Candidatus Gracilibacteria bacterium]
MTFQQYIQQKNLDISIVNLEDLENHNRFDSEFYAVDILGLRNKLKSNGSKKLLDYKVNIKRGINPNYSENGEIKVLRSVNIRENGFSDTRQDFISFETYDSINNGKTKKQDILLNVTGVGTLGRSSFVFDDEKYVFSQDVVALRNFKDILPEFLFTYLNSSLGQKQINVLYKGSSGQIHLYPDDIEEILVPLVSFQTQIANLVQESFKQKELSKKLYLEAENLLLSELGLENYKPTEKNISIKDSEEVDIFGRFDAEYFQPKYDEIFEKVKNYKGGYDTLENLITISNEKIKKEQDKTFKYIELADINASLGVVNVENEILSQELPSRAQMKIKIGDVLVSSLAGSADKVAIIINEDKNLVASTGFFVLRSKFFNPETNLILMKSWIYKDMLIRSARGMIMEATNKEDFSKFILPKIDIKIQEKIAELVKESHKSLDLSKQLLEKAKKSVEIFIEEDEEKAGKFLES